MKAPTWMITTHSSDLNSVFWKNSEGNITTCILDFIEIAFDQWMNWTPSAEIFPCSVVSQQKYCTKIYMLRTCSHSNPHSNQEPDREECMLQKAMNQGRQRRRFSRRRTLGTMKVGINFVLNRLWAGELAYHTQKGVSETKVSMVPWQLRPRWIILSCRWRPGKKQWGTRGQWPQAVAFSPGQCGTTLSNMPCAGWHKTILPI